MSKRAGKGASTFFMLKLTCFRYSSEKEEPNQALHKKMIQLFSLGEEARVNCGAVLGWQQWCVTVRVTGEGGVGSTPSTFGMYRPA